MNKKCALYIPVKGASSLMIAHGYSAALSKSGWDPILHPAELKIEVARLVEEYDVKLIFTTCRYGTRQLPVDTINRHGVAVVCRALLHNESGSTFGGTSEPVDPADTDILRRIERVCVWTHLEKNIRDRYMGSWETAGFDLLHLPFAGNLVKATPSSFAKKRDIVFIANLAHRMESAAGWIAPLVRRLCQGASIEAFGDRGWARLGMDTRHLNEAYDKVADLYAQSVCSPNVHTVPQRREQACLNERSFTVPLCGGHQVIDMPLAGKYFGDRVEIATSPSEFVQAVERRVRDQGTDWDRIFETAEYCAKTHTYFNRLHDLFLDLGMESDAEEAVKAGEREVFRHMNEMKEAKKNK